MILTNNKLPNSLTTINEGAFYNCAELELTELPPNLTTLGQLAFNSCTKINLKTLPSSLKRLNSRTFSYCNLITQMSMDGIETIIGSSSSSAPFYSCGNLKGIWVGSSVTGIGRYAFAGISNLKKVYINLSRATVESMANYAYAFMGDGNKQNLIVCNDDTDFITKEEFDAIDWSIQ
jgi:hypothetical protein